MHSELPARRKAVGSFKKCFEITFFFKSYKLRYIFLDTKKTMLYRAYIFFPWRIRCRNKSI